MDLGIEGKVALVAASSQGLGKAVAKGFASEGAKVVICSRNAEALSAARTEITEATGAEIKTVVADLTSADDIVHLVDEAVATYGTVDILVNNAGGPPAGFFADMSDDLWQKGFELTLMSSVRMTRAVLPFMQRRKWGRIVNITSMSVKQPINELLLSNSLRMSVIGWAKTLSNQVAKDGILVNNVCPGWTRTDRLLEIFGARAKTAKASPETIENGIVSMIPMARLGEPEELANLVVFLGSQRASYITGTAIQVDGGFVQSFY